MSANHIELPTLFGPFQPANSSKCRLCISTVSRSSESSISRVSRATSAKRCMAHSESSQVFSRHLTTLCRIKLLAASLSLLSLVSGQSTHISQLDPRPTIYSGQVSFGLLLSAHSSMGSEMATSASQQVLAIAARSGETMGTTLAASQLDYVTSYSDVTNQVNKNASASISEILQGGGSARPAGQQRRRTRRQIFESNSARGRQHLREREQRDSYDQQGGASKPDPQASASAGAQPNAACSQVNPNALYAGMGAIWASHQANLIGDSQFTIGAYVYDSCNDLDVGQRQSVRIVSNLNAFQQTTCESPRGSPISLIIAHGDNQMRAIQLLTSFRVPVISTKEHLALEDFQVLTRDQRRFLFSTAPSSRHLALGALRFARRVAFKATMSAKLPNQHYKSSPRNGLIVVSRNLPTRFMAYLAETIPLMVNYELIQSSSPIDQIRSVEVIESIMMRPVKRNNDDVTDKAASLVHSIDAESSSSPSTVDTDHAPEPSASHSRRTRSSEAADEATAWASDNDGPNLRDGKMLSPMILMFITPAEAIDLITRLRNDLAEVSKYYSLIVATREDITPALKTIFHRGGSRLCAGKAFYTISPKPDDIGEFGRYFRDTVQIEAETSDHPLISEFSKYQAGTRITADLDDVGAEPVIKAVWAAAAAFKAVHKRECGQAAAAAATASGGSTSGTSTNSGAPGATSARSTSTEDKAPTATRQIKSRQPNVSQSGTKSVHSECMMRMSKTMSQMVKNKLKMLDVTINSTGLQAFDGFRIKFDGENELMSNKFSIRHINKECEIEEVGHFSGFDDSKLLLDKEALERALDSTMPEAWPMPPPPPPPTPSAPPSGAKSSVSYEGGATSAGAGSSASPSSTDTTGRPIASHGGSANDDSSSASETGEAPRQRKYQQSINMQIDNIGLSKPDEDGDDSSGSSGDFDGGNNSAVTAKRSTNKRSRTSIGDISSGLKKPQAKQQDYLATTTTIPTTNSNRHGLRQSYMDSREPTTMPPSSMKPMRTLRPFPTPAGTLVRDWLPVSSPSSTIEDTGSQQRPATKATPEIYTTLPESDGNADFETATRVTRSEEHDRRREAQQQNGLVSKGLDASATTESSAYITMPTGGLGSNPSGNNLRGSAISTFGRQPHPNFGFDFASPLGQLRDSPMSNGSTPSSALDFLKDLNFSPVPLMSANNQNQQGQQQQQQQQQQIPSAFLRPELLEQLSESRTNRSQLRSHLKWIYNSWSALGILMANIFGALLTLYVLTFMLMKNCNGSLYRENQGLRSIHLLGIIVVFFGSTLFIVSPTPGLCLLRNSWHNFSLVMLFGSLTLQTMQLRSLSTLGLGGRPNKLNQFLTLVFMVGVQVALELQRWKYESASYLNFINQNFGSPEGDYKKLMILGNAIMNQFNPLSPFSDLVTPVSIQVSEKYQNLLHDYCLLKPDDFLQSQIYLCMIIVLLLIFSVTTRNANAYHHSGGQQSSASFLTSGKIVVSEHEANLTAASQFQPTTTASPLPSSSAPTTIPFPANSANHINHHHHSILDGSAKLLPVTIMDATVYFVSLLLQYNGQNGSNADSISSISMVLIAFITLVGIFMPILNEIHRFDTMSGSTLSRPTNLTEHQQTILPDLNRNHLVGSMTTSKTFTMFPELSQVGIRRQSSLGGNSSAGSSRSPFAETKESRRNMGFTLASMALPPSDSPHELAGYYGQEGKSVLEDLAQDVDVDHDHKHNQDYQLHHKRNSRQIQSNTNQHGASQESLQILDNSSKHFKAQTKALAKGEKRLIMLDVDPCCPRHGHAVQPKARDQYTSKGRPC